jgi:hypothetical protein
LIARRAFKTGEIVMSFEDFIAQSVDARAADGSFQHSRHTVPRFDQPTEAQSKEAIAKAVEIQKEIAAKFDTEYSPNVTQMNELMRQVQSFHASGSLQPLALFQAQCCLMGHLVTICQSYQTNADVLARLGASGFRDYLKKLFDDASQALASLNKTSAAGMQGPSLDAASFLASLARGVPRNAHSEPQVIDAPAFDPAHGPMWGYSGQRPPALAPMPGMDPSLPFLPSPPFARP